MKKTNYVKDVLVVLLGTLINTMKSPFQISLLYTALKCVYGSNLTFYALYNFREHS